ncbi:MAG: endonuclease domain-containing protein [Coriobacteriia bacterium]|nr:endonuclease domain-containing protein [Coriobacteriia bacterium]
MELKRAGKLGAKRCVVDGCTRYAVQNDKCPAHLHRSRKYGLSDEEMARLDAGVPCDICGAPATDVDHSHSTGLVRGYLCSPCNLTLGKMKDSPALLRRAADYLERVRTNASVRGPAVENESETPRA